MKRYKAVIVQRTYQSVMLDVDDDFEYSQEDVKQMLLDEFDPIANNSESETEVCDIEEIF